MKFGALEQGELRLEDRPEPQPGPGEITVSLAACGICGTDLEKLRGNYRTAGILGHEAVGLVRDVGKGVGLLTAGTRVFVHHHVPCGKCEICRKGAPTFCPDYAKTNLDPGGFAETFRVSSVHVRAGAVLPLAPSVTWDEGALLEPAACALTALRTIGVPPGQRVMILGLGPVGLLYARMARALGAAWIGGTELSELRAAAAKKGGIDTIVDPRAESEVQETVQKASNGFGADLVVVATGAPSATRLAFDLVRRGGTVNLFGLPEPGYRLEQDLQRLYLRGIRVVPTYATTEDAISETHRMIASRQLQVADLVSDHFPLHRIREAFARAQNPADALKVVVTGPAYGG